MNPINLITENISLLSLLFFLIIFHLIINKKSFEIQTIYLITIFYSIAIFISSDLVNYYHGVIYDFEIEIISIYLISIFSVFFPFFFEKKIPEIKCKFYEEPIVQYCLAGLGILAISLNTFLNFHSLNLGKIEYILAEKKSNLIIMHIPAETLVLGIAFFGKKINKEFRILLFIIYLYSVFLDFNLGYRFFLMLLGLIACRCFFKNYYFISTLFLMTLAGELVNKLKFEIQYGAGINLHRIFEHWLTNFQILTAEQIAIFSNFILGKNSDIYFNSIRELSYFIPMYGKFWPIPYPTATDTLASLAGIDTRTGYGLAFNYQLFLQENILVGIVILFTFSIIVILFQNTIFSFILIEIFFAMMRNSVSYWSGIFMKFFILLTFSYFCFFIFSKLKNHKF